jgi:arsenite-transporting ATPase
MNPRLAIIRLFFGSFIILNDGQYSSAFVSPSLHRPTVNAWSQHQPHNTRLLALTELLNEVCNKGDSQTKTIFVGGKGGVGKSTVASALATSLASTVEHQLKVLVVSTDPAHSLGDALDEDLRKGQGKPLQLTDSLTGGRLYAQEIDAAAALDSFRESLAAFDVQRLAETLGVSADLLESLGLNEFSGLLNNPPPGLDELVALSDVLGDASRAGAYDVIVVDTAPTGHTLRLLQLPQFLNGLLGKLIQLRLKLAGLASTLQSFFGNNEATQRAKAIDDAANRLDAFKDKMATMQQQLRDPSRTDFIVVTVPTKLGVAESKRLIQELTSQGVRVSDLVVNQCIGDAAAMELDSEALNGYYSRRKAGQMRWINNLQEAIDEVSASDAYRDNGGSGAIALTKIPFFDVELVGVPALAYAGSQIYAGNPSYAHLMNADDSSMEPRLIICGGKGGTGKTTTAASLAVSMAADGHNVAIISTDPAHSLGDALDISLSGGMLQDVPLLGVPPGDGSLSAMEIDPTTALGQFKGIVDKLIGSDSDKGESGGLRSTLKDLEEIFNTLPAGTDEVVALAKIVNLVKKGNFDRIVLDTAPTGHTLRMLSTPGFIAELIDRLLMIADKINSNSMVKLLVSGGENAEMVESAAAAAKSQLISFQLQMYDLEDMFVDSELTEFVIVTVPTELAARESIRLLNDLTYEDPIKVRNLVVNQVLGDDEKDAKTFLEHVATTQKASITNLEQSMSKLQDPPRITVAQYLDTEPRGVFGLRVFANELFKDS